MTGQGGWPLTVFLDSEAVPFYGGTYFPPEPRQGLPSFRQVLEATAGAYETQREELREASARIRESLGDGRPRRAVGASHSIESLLDRGDLRACRAGLRPGQRRLRRRAQVPARQRARVPARSRRDGAGRAHPRQDDARRDLRPARRRLRPLLGRRQLARPPLREDALRQRAAGARLSARLAGDGRGALDAGLRRDPRLGAARDVAAPRAASTPPSTPTRRARRAASTSGTRTRCARPSARRASPPTPIERVLGYWGVSAGGQLRGQEHPARSARRRAPSSRPSSPMPAPPSTPGATPRAPRPRRQADLLLERADDRRARRRRRRARPPGLPRRRLGLRPLHLGVDAGLRGAPAPHLEGGRGAAQRLPRGSRVPGRGAAAPLRGDARGALVRRRPRDGRRDDRALRRRRERGLLHHLQRPRGADRPAQGRRGPPDPLRELLRRLRPAAARGPDRRARLRGPCHRSDPPVRCRRRRSTPTPSATCCRRSTSTSPPSARSPWSRPATAPASSASLGELAAVVRSAYRPHVVLAGGPEGAERPELLRERGAVEGKPAAYVCEHFACKAPVPTRLRNRSLACASSSTRQRIGRNCSISNGVTCTR